jgi:hypothetical protein
MRVSTFIVSILFIGLLVGIFGFFFAAGSFEAGVTYDNETFSAYDQFGTINSTVFGEESINSTIGEVDLDNPLDLIGGFLKSGYQVIKVTWTSFGAFNSMADDAFDKVGDAGGLNGMPQNGLTASNIKAILILIVFVLFIFITVSVFVGRDV